MVTAAVGNLIDGLVAAYRARVPDVRRIERHLVNDGAIAQDGGLANDHIAFRTLGAPQLGIASVEPLFLHHGFERRDAYRFAAKHLDAYWYAPPEPTLPRIFLSELRIDELPSGAARVVRSYTDRVERAPLQGVDFDEPAAMIAALAALPWPVPNFADYRMLLGESEYAAWTLVNGYALNHMTLSVNDLGNNLSSVAALNDYLEARGFELNASGGKVKTSPDGLLLQSSTRAKPVEAVFADGVTALAAGPYIEFAERRVLPEFAHLAPADTRSEHRRDGFEAVNADRIFESTDIAESQCALR